MSTTNNKSRSLTKKAIPLILSILVFVIVFLVVFPQFAEYEDVLEILSSINSYQLLALILVTIINIFVYVLPFMAATPGIKYWPAFMVRQTSFLISNGIPGGGTIGVGVQYAMTTGYDITGSRASSGIIITSLWNMLATLTLPGLTVILLIITDSFSGDYLLIAILGIIASIISIGSFIVLFKSVRLTKVFARYIDTTYESIRNVFVFMPKIKIIKSLLNFRKTTYQTTIKNWKSLTVTNILQQFSQFFVLYAALEILASGSISFVAALAAFAFARVGTFIPLTPGGLGTVDAIMVTLLVQGGVSSEVALAATLIWRAATYFPQLAIGGLTFFVWRLKSSK